VTLALVISLVFVLAGGVLLVLGGTVATAIAMSLLGFAGVIWVSLAFFAVGRSEDRDREASQAGGAARSGPEADPRSEPEAERPGPVHKEPRPDHHFRRRPS
jgi:hypothetical protein